LSCCVQGTGCRCGLARGRTAPICNSNRKKREGKSSVRGRRDSGDPRLKQATAKGFGRSPLPSSGATAEVQDRPEDFSVDGSVEDNQKEQEWGASRGNPNQEATKRNSESHVVVPRGEVLGGDTTKKAREEAYRSKVLELASKSTYINNKIFFYPDPAVASNQLELFFNRGLSVLAEQPVIFVKGGYNDWRWGSFVAELQKTNDLEGDWWSCKIDIPKEAYKVEFIFFDGQNTFENNSGNNFFIQIEGGMTKADFEYFLVEEKAKEARRLADEKVRKEFEAAEAQRLAEHRAAEAVDRAEAKRIVGERRESAREALQKAVRRVHGLWYIEPSEFGGGNRVILYYNRSSRPLAQSEEIWLHGGHNNWENMVSIIAKLRPAKLAKTYELDWWCVEGTVPTLSTYSHLLVVDLDAVYELG
jgi:hypothetical protein